MRHFFLTIFCYASSVHAQQQANIETGAVQGQRGLTFGKVKVNPKLDYSVIGRSVNNEPVELTKLWDIYLQALADWQRIKIDAYGVLSRQTNEENKFGGSIDGKILLTRGIISITPEAGASRDPNKVNPDSNKFFDNGETYYGTNLNIDYSKTTQELIARRSNEKTIFSETAIEANSDSVKYDIKISSYKVISGKFEYDRTNIERKTDFLPTEEDKTEQMTGALLYGPFFYTLIGGRTGKTQNRADTGVKTTLESHGIEFKTSPSEKHNFGGAYLKNTTITADQELQDRFLEGEISYRPSEKLNLLISYKDGQGIDKFRGLTFSKEFRIFIDLKNARDRFDQSLEFKNAQITIDGEDLGVAKTFVSKSRLKFRKFLSIGLNYYYSLNDRGTDISQNSSDLDDTNIKKKIKTHTVKAILTAFY